MANLHVCMLLFVCGVLLSPMYTEAATNLNPGFKMRITQSGLDSLRDSGLKILTQLYYLQLPIFSGEAYVPVVGPYSYTISNLRIKNILIPSATLTTREGVGLVLSTDGVSLSISGNWHYCSNYGYIHVNDSGFFDVSVSGARLGLTLRIGVDKEGRPTISSKSEDCSFYISNVNVELHGGASWLYNLFSDNIADALKSSMNKQTCSKIITVINEDLQEGLPKLRTEVALGDKAVIDYSLLTSPSFSGHLDTSHKGEVCASDMPRTEAPFTVPVIPADPDSSRHVFLWATDYLFETAGFVYFKAGTFVYNVTHDMLPPGQSCTLKTSSWCVEASLPKLNKMYPDMPMGVDVIATAPPRVNITQAHINGSLDLDMSFSVILPNKSKVYLFTLNTTVHGSSQLSCKGRTLNWKSNLVRVDVGVKRSAVGKFDVNLLSEGINSGCRFIIIPMLDNEGEKGFPIPSTPDISLERPVIQQGKGFIKLGADIRYTPTIGY